MKEETKLFVVSGLCSITVLILIYVMLSIGTRQL